MDSTEGASFLRKRIDLEDARIDVTVPARPGPGPLIATSHPADVFDEATAGVLAEASGLDVVCVNPRGLGLSSPPPAGRRHTLELMVDDLERVRLQLGLGAWVFWGMSGGGWLGQIYAHRYPQSVAGLILESTCPCYRERLADPACLLSPFHPSWRLSLAAQGLIASDSHAAVGDLEETEWVEVAGVGSVFRRRNGPALLVAPFPISAEMRAIMPALWAVDTRSWLASLRVPTLVICGSLDPVVPTSHARDLHERIAGSDLVIVEGAGHVPVAQRRREVGQAVRRFFRPRGDS